MLGNPQPAPAVAPVLSAPNPSVAITELRPGSGRAIQPGDLVTVHFQVETADGKEIANTHKRGLPYSVEFRMGESFWSAMLTGMRAGGERKVSLQSDLFFGEGGVTGIVPSGTMLMATVKVISSAPATKPDAHTVAIKRGS